MSEALPALPPAVREVLVGGQTCFVATASSEGMPDVAPISWIVAVDDRTIRMALSKAHQTTANIRATGRVAIAVVDTGVASTVLGSARIVKEGLIHGPHDVLVEVTVTGIKKDAGRSLHIENGVTYSWTTVDGPGREAGIVNELKHGRE